MIRAVLVLVLALAAIAPATASADGWTWPVKGELVSPYRYAGNPYDGGQHRGIDVAAPEGARVVAAHAGRVRFAGVAGSSGSTVSVRTADGRFDTSYLHLSALDVSEGEEVGAGDSIGAVGTTGRRSTGTAHLHFGVRVAGRRHGYRDPLDFLPPRPGTRDTPRGVPTPVALPIRVGPAPQPTHIPSFAPAPEPVPRRVPSLAGIDLGWALACAALILAAALIGGASRSDSRWGKHDRSSIGLRAVLRHNADLLRQR